MKRARRRIEALLAVANRPLTGLEIAAITRTWSGQLYAALRQLEREGVATSEWIYPTDGGRRQRVYERAR